MKGSFLLYSYDKTKKKASLQKYQTLKNLPNPLKFALSILFTLQVSMPAALAAGKHDATLTRYFGKVTILTNPKEKVTPPGPHALYDDLYYTAVKPKRGMAIPTGSVIQTGPRSRARLVFANGDQVSVTSNSHYQLMGKKGKVVGSEKPVVNMLFGAIRATIQKGGPRKGLEVKTRTLSMGVRGTEFHVTANSKTGSSAISVLRGTVAVKAKDQKKAVEIPSGYSVEVPKAAPPKKGVKKAPPPKIVLAKTTKKQLLTIQKTTVVKKTASEKISKEEEEKLEKLEKKAVETTMQDIKEEDPGLYQALKDSEAKGKKLDMDNIQTVTVKKAYKEAPKSVKEVKKPTTEDLEMDDEEVYEKYFQLD